MNWNGWTDRASKTSSFLEETKMIKGLLLLFLKKNAILIPVK